MKYLIANLKAHHSFQEIQTWISTFVNGYSPREGWVIGIAPSFPHLSYVASQLKTVQGCAVVAQSVSEEAEGSFTGEVTARALRELTSYCIVGHSERRQRGEGPDQIKRKLEHLANEGIQPILCIGSGEEYIDGYSGIIAYEPPTLIGTGTVADLGTVSKLRAGIPQVSTFIYGASVDEHNCATFLSSPDIDGMLVGTASIDPNQFLAIVAQL